ncbi:uncharacterized protein EAF01_000385 [Botrytis porri]|uniref:uncharacterized protein n=1 Tax=Botrytis porri TaxID=87229 RepID=UPI001902A34D|nr:uncharacterized protein EAF01_000385 [Botrytis porri]KAF7913979.1 hypothetical protein EAF01_000385 [Botrytis porri]
MLRKRLVYSGCLTEMLNQRDYQKGYANREWGENAADFFGDYSVLNHSGEFGYLLSSVSRPGSFTPWVIIGCMCSAIGSGYMSLFKVNTGAGEWIGF